MQSMVDVVVEKYMRPEQATEFMEYLLRLALYDLEEVWADECSGLEQRVAIATETASEHGRELQTLRGRFAQMVMEAEQQRLRADALEAENIYLCNDGVWRQRCGRHIEEQGPYAPVNAANRRESSG